MRVLAFLTQTLSKIRLLLCKTIQKRMKIKLSFEGVAMVVSATRPRNGHSLHLSMQRRPFPIAVEGTVIDIYIYIYDILSRHF